MTRAKGHFGHEPCPRPDTCGPAVRICPSGFSFLWLGLVLPSHAFLYDGVSMKSNDPFRRWFITATVISGHKTLRVTIHLAAVTIYKSDIRRAPRVPREPHGCPYGNVPGHPTQPAASGADRELGAQEFVHA